MKTVYRFGLVGLAVLPLCYGQAVISTIAGNGTSIYSGDGGPATKAGIDLAFDVATDGAGNLYIVGGGSNRIRKVDTLGVITTFAGNGTADDAGDGGPASNAEIAFPLSVAVDKTGNVFI